MVVLRSFRPQRFTPHWVYPAPRYTTAAVRAAAIAISRTTIRTLSDRGLAPLIRLLRRPFSARVLAWFTEVRPSTTTPVRDWRPPRQQPWRLVSAFRLRR